MSITRAESSGKQIILDFEHVTTVGKNVMVYIWTVNHIFWVSIGNCHVNKPGSHLILNSDNHQMRVNLEVQTELKILRLTTFRYLQTWRLQALEFKVSRVGSPDMLIKCSDFHKWLFSRYKENDRSDHSIDVRPSSTSPCQVLQCQPYFQKSPKNYKKMTLDNMKFVETKWVHFGTSVLSQNPTCCF